MCNNEVWVLLGLILIITWTNAALRKNDDNDLSESSSSDNDSHTKHSRRTERAGMDNSHKKHHHRSSHRAGEKQSILRARNDHDTEGIGQTQAVWVSKEEEENGLNIEFEVDKLKTTKVDSEKEQWPKLLERSRRYKKVKKGRSTTRRLSPLFLMQKSGESKEKKKPPEDLSHFTLLHPPDLSPYSMKEEMLKMAQKFTGINISVEVLGKTVEYNEIVLVKASDMPAKSRTRFRAEDNKFIDEPPEKKIIFIVHALNVQGMDVVPCLSRPPDLEKLLALYFAHLENFDIFIIPMANPDGYAHLRSHSPWSKNRSPQSACPGVNVDRNFDISWSNGKGGEISSCSQQYPGPSPFSEPESRAVRDVLHLYGHKIIAYIHVHAGMDTSQYYKGDAVLYPRGYTDTAIDDDRYVDLRFELDEMMRNASFQVVTVSMETLHSWYGKVIGTSVDYASEVYGIPYALEFAMQVYEPHINHIDLPDYPTMSLTEIWRRVIDTVFNTIWVKTSIVPA